MGIFTYSAQITAAAAALVAKNVTGLDAERADGNWARVEQAHLAQGVEAPERRREQRRRRRRRGPQRAPEVA